MMLFSIFTRDTLKYFCYKLFHISLFRCLKGSLKASDCKEVKNMQRSRTGAIRTQLQPQKQKREITNMTNSQSTKRKNTNSGKSNRSMKTERIITLIICTLFNFF